MRLWSNLGEFLLLLSTKFILMLVLQDSAHFTLISQLPCSLCELALNPLPVPSLGALYSRAVLFLLVVLNSQNTIKCCCGLGCNGSALSKIKPVCVACEV